MKNSRQTQTYGFVCTLILLSAAVMACKLLPGRGAKTSLVSATEVQNAVAAFKKKVGGSVRAIGFSVDQDKITIQAQDPNNLKHIDEYKYDGYFVSGPKPVDLGMLLDNSLDHNLFSLDDINFGAMSSLIDTSLSRTKLEGGKVRSMDLRRHFFIDQSAKTSINMGEPQWNISVQGDRATATVYANGKGEIIKVDLPRVE